jgi:hypothetical protein
VSQLAATFVHGDEGSIFEYEVKDAGAAFDVTGAGTITLHMVKAGETGDTIVNVSGTIQSPASAGVFEFAGVGDAVAAPSARMRPDVYECRVSFVISTLTYWTEACRIQIVKFP